MPKILVVDDMEEIIRLLEINLNRSGYETLTARDGDEASEILKTEFPDLIISDVTMPRKDGFALLEEVRSNPLTRETPFIFLTVKSQDADVWTGIDRGVDAYLNKPFSPKELLETVARVLDEKHPAPPSGSMKIDG